MAVHKIEGDKTKALVIQNFVVARPPLRTNFDIADWRSALDHAELKDMPNRTNLYDIYADVLLDPHLSRQWAKRVEKVANTKWAFTVGEKEEESMTLFIDTPQFEEILVEIMNTLAWGISVVELGQKEVLEYGIKQKRLTVYSVPRKHIKPETGIITEEQYDSVETTGGIKYREGRYAQYVFEVGKPKDLGLLLNIAPYVLLKKGGVSDWALFVQLFGQPFREYKYDGYNETTRQLLEKSAQEMASAPYIIMPEGAQLTLHDLKNNNSAEIHPSLIKYCDDMISIHILGNTETTQSSSSSGHAQASVHKETEDDVYTSDIRRVRRVLNNLVRPILYNLGFPVKDGVFHPVEETDIDEILQRLKVLKEVKALGEPVDADHIYETSGVPKPDNYDTLKSEMEAKAEANTPGAKVPIKKGPTAAKKKLTDDPEEENVSFWNKLKALFDFFDQAP